MQIKEAVGFVTQALQDFADRLPPSLQCAFLSTCRESLEVINVRLKVADDLEQVIDGLDK